MRIKLRDLFQFMVIFLLGLNMRSILFDVGLSREVQINHQESVLPHNFTYNNITNEKVSPCASWLPGNQRKVLLVDFRLDGVSWMTEEYHMSLSLVKTLLKLEIDVHYVEKTHFENDMEQRDMLAYYRIFFISRVDERWTWSRHFDRREIFCKVRILFPDTTARIEDEVFKQETARFHDKQLLLAHQFAGSSLVGYYPFIPKGTVQPKPNERDKVGFVVLPARSQVSQKDVRILQKLTESGNKIHLVSAHFEISEMSNILPSNVASYHDASSQEQTLNLLSQSSFLLSFEHKLSMPLSAIGIYFGVSIINLRSSTKDGHSQAPFLSGMRMPYVYNVNYGDENGIVKATEHSHLYRYDSLTIFSVGEFEDSICAIVEDDSICSCPNTGIDSDVIDCRAEFYMKKNVIFPGMGG